MDMRASPRRHEFNIKKALKLIVFEWLHIRKLQPPALSAHHVDDKLTEALVRLQLPKLQQLGGYTIDAGWISWGPRPRPYEPVRELISSLLPSLFLAVSHARAPRACTGTCPSP
jgi:hypothetical protein